MCESHSAAITICTLYFFPRFLPETRVGPNTHFWSLLSRFFFSSRKSIRVLIVSKPFEMIWKSAKNKNYLSQKESRRGGIPLLFQRYQLQMLFVCLMVASRCGSFLALGHLYWTSDVCHVPIYSINLCLWTLLRELLQSVFQLEQILCPERTLVSSSWTTSVFAECSRSTHCLGLIGVSSVLHGRTLLHSCIFAQCATCSSFPSNISVSSYDRRDGKSSLVENG